MPAVPGPGGPPPHVDLAAVPAQAAEDNNDENGAVLDVARIGPAPAPTFQPYLRLPSGIKIPLELTDEQQKRFYDLCREIAGVEEFDINISDLLLTKKGGEPTPLSLEDGKRLQEFIKTEAKKKDFKFSRTYASPEARSFERAPKSEWPLSKFPTIDFKVLFSKEKLDGTEFTFSDKVERLKRHRVQELLIDQARQHLRAIAEKLKAEEEASDGQQRLAIQGRLQRIKQAFQELNHNPFAIAFEAIHPLPHPTSETIEAKRKLAMELLETTRDAGVKAKAKMVWNFLTGKGPTDVEDAAKDLALGSIKDRGEYLTYCALLRTVSKKEGVEHLFNRLVDRIAENGDTDAILEGHLFKTTFGDIIAEEDAQDLKRALQQDCETLKGVFQSVQSGDFMDIEDDIEALKNAIDLGFAG